MTIKLIPPISFQRYTAQFESSSRKHVPVQTKDCCNLRFNSCIRLHLAVRSWYGSMSFWLMLWVSMFLFPLRLSRIFLKRINGYCGDVWSLRTPQSMYEGIVSQERTACQTAAGENLVTRCNWAAEKVSGNKDSSLGCANGEVTYQKVRGRSGTKWQWSDGMWEILHSSKLRMWTCC